MTGIKKLILGLKSMPSPLSGFTVVLWLSGVIFVISSMIPGWEDVDTGREVPHHELWSRFDGGPAIFLLGCALFGIGYMIYRGWWWVRHILMLGIVAIAVSGLVNPAYCDVPTWILVSLALVTFVFGLRYFYFKKQVVSYFTKKTN